MGGTGTLCLISLGGGSGTRAGGSVAERIKRLSQAAVCLFVENTKRKNSGQYVDYTRTGGKHQCRVVSAPFAR